MSKQEKLKKITSEHTSKWLEEAAKKVANTGARKNARKVALRVLQILRERDISQTALAQRMGVSRQQVTKIVKGQENFTFETIDKLEKALDITLMTITAHAEAPAFDVTQFRGVVELPPSGWATSPVWFDLADPSSDHVWSISKAVPTYTYMVANSVIVADRYKRIFSYLNSLHPRSLSWETCMPIVSGTEQQVSEISEEYKIENKEKIDYSRS
jgi:DNA-binding Xre family transcriptional regulator